MYAIRVCPTLNVGRARRHFEHLIHEAPSADRKAYLEYLLTLFEKYVAEGQPVPVAELLPMYEEEFE